VIVQGQPDAKVREQTARFTEAYSVLQQAIDARAFPGCAFGLLAQGEVLLSDALGRFTYESDSAAVTPATLFDIASVSKVAATTAAATMQYQRGLLDLGTPVGELLPGFVIGRDPAQHARKVTIRHLLAHSSGLPGYVPLFHTATSASELMRETLLLPIEAEPGSRAEYSDHGFILLGKAIETLVGEALPTFVHREIFTPLGMAHTGYCPPAWIRPAIPPTEVDELFRQRTIQGEVQDEHAYLLKGVAGHAGLFSNVSDLLRFSEAILAADGSSLFSRAAIDTFAERQMPHGSSRALGWDTPSENSSSGQYFSPSAIGHLGYSGCSLWIDREAEVAIVLLTNRTWPNRESQMIRAVRPAFHDALRKAL